MLNYYREENRQYGDSDNSFPNNVAYCVHCGGDECDPEECVVELITASELVHGPIRLDTQSRLQIVAERRELCIGCDNDSTECTCDGEDEFMPKGVEAYFVSETLKEADEVVRDNTFFSIGSVDEDSLNLRGLRRDATWASFHSQSDTSCYASRPDLRCWKSPTRTFYWKDKEERRDRCIKQWSVKKPGLIDISEAVGDWRTRADEEDRRAAAKEAYDRACAESLDEEQMLLEEEDADMYANWRADQDFVEAAEENRLREECELHVLTETLAALKLGHFAVEGVFNDGDLVYAVGGADIFPVSTEDPTPDLTAQHYVRLLPGKRIKSLSTSLNEANIAYA